MAGIVAAIDLGTSRTAYSYTILGEDDGDKPRILLGVPDGLGDATIALERKTATSILLKKSERSRGGWHLQTFGDKAEREYLDAKTSHGGHDLALFKHFKMELFQGGRDRKGGRAVDDVMGVATDNSVKLPLVYVVSLALGHIKTQIIERLNNSDQVTLRSSDIRWVLTVPAIWSAFGKTFMRAAAHRGGLVDHEDDQEKLKMCLEPEAACLSVEHNNMQPWLTGTNLMILDCGGGTIDITTHQVVETAPLSLKELNEPTGGPWGSTVLDAKFKQFLKELLRCNDEQWEALNRSHIMLDLMLDWEEKKTDYSRGQVLRLQLGDILDQVGMAAHTFNAAVYNFNSKKPGVKSTGRVLKIEPEFMSTLFHGVCKEIVGAMTETLAKQSAISTVYMVGGFSSSPLLQEAVSAGLRERYGGVRMIAPRWPGLAIVIGAALFGANDRSIVSRKARLTYGTWCAHRYNELNTAHCQRIGNMFHSDGKMYLDVFSDFVERGEDLPVGTNREHTFYPLGNSQNHINFDIIVSSRPVADVKYLKDEGVKDMVTNLTAVEVPLDMNVPFKFRGVCMRLSFGGTELGIRGKRCSDGKEVNATTVYIEELVEDTNRARVV